MALKIGSRILVLVCLLGADWAFADPPNFMMSDEQLKVALEKADVVAEGTVRDPLEMTGKEDRYTVRVKRLLEVREALKGSPKSPAYLLYSELKKGIDPGLSYGWRTYPAGTRKWWVLKWSEEDGAYLEAMGPWGGFTPDQLRRVLTPRPVPPPVVEGKAVSFKGSKGWAYLGESLFTGIHRLTLALPAGSRSDSTYQNGVIVSQCACWANGDRYLETRYANPPLSGESVTSHPNGIAIYEIAWKVDAVQHQQVFRRIYRTPEGRVISELKGEVNVGSDGLPFSGRLPSLYDERGKVLREDEFRQGKLIQVRLSELPPRP